MTTSRALRIDDLLSLPVLSDPQLSPDGLRAAYVVTVPDAAADSYVSSIWCVSTGADETPTQLTEGPQDSAPRWSADGAELAFVRARDDGGADLLVLALAAGGVRKATALPGGIIDPQWAPDGRHIALLSVVRPDVAEHAPVVIDRLQYKEDGTGLTRGRRTHLFTLEVGTGAVHQVTDGDFSVTSARWSADGRELAFAAAMGPDRDLGTSSAVFVVPVTGGEPEPLSPLEGRLMAPAWFPDGKRVLVCGQPRLKAGHLRLFAAARPGGPLEPAAELDRNVMLGSRGYPGALPLVLPDERVVFLARDAGCTQIYAAGPDLIARRLVGGIGRSLTGLSAAGGLLAYVASDGGTNGELWVCAQDGSGERQLTRHFAGALPDVALTRPTPRLFSAPDGGTRRGWLLRSEGVSGPTPLLVDIHGGPHGSWGPAFEGVHLHQQALVDQGWTVLLLNPLGSDGEGEGFYTAVSEDWGFSDEGDFLAAVDELVAEGLVDPGKVVLTGYSYGGYMTCWLSARYPDRWAAAIPGGMATDLAVMAGTADIGGYLSAVELGGKPWEVSDPIRARSPLTHVARVTAPTLLLHGEQDDRCPMSQAELWFSALRTRQVPVTLVRYPDAGHQFIISGRPSHRQDWCTRIVDFALEHCP